MVPEHRRGHGALYGVLSRGRIDVERLRTLLAGLPLPRFEGGRLVLAVDVSPWLRSDAPCSADRLFCHVYGRAKSAAQFIPGWPYSFVAVLEPGATSWTSILDVVRLGPEDDATAVTATQLRAVAEQLISAGQWTPGDPDITIVMDAGYDVTRLAWVLRDLPIGLVGRIRSDRAMRLPKPSLKEYALAYPQGGRPPKHGKEFRFAKPETWPEAAIGFSSGAWRLFACGGPERRSRDRRIHCDASAWQMCRFVSRSSGPWGRSCPRGYGTPVRVTGCRTWRRPGRSSCSQPGRTAGSCSGGCSGPGSCTTRRRLRRSPRGRPGP
jgi:hypothetical protein